MFLGWCLLKKKSVILIKTSNKNVELIKKKIKKIEDTFFY